MNHWAMIKRGNEIALIDILSTGENTMIEDLELKHLKSELLKHMDTLEPLGTTCFNHAVRIKG